VITAVAEINGVRDSLPADLHVDVPPRQARRLFAWDLFKTRQLTIYTLSAVFAWFMVSTINYGMFFDIGNLPSDVYLSMTILAVTALVEIPLGFYDYYNPKLNRKTVMLVCIAIVVATNVLITVLFATSVKAGVLFAVISIVGQNVTNIIFDTAYVFAIELFPTLLRTIAGSLCSVGARIGAIIAPQLLFLEKYWEPLPYLSFAVVGTVGFVVVLFALPNTKETALPESIGDRVQERDTGDRSSGIALPIPEPTPAAAATAEEEEGEKRSATPL
jgi:MFS transporter, OCT family, solute carrier family 22 (organic cation transporter), member 4/5